ncbi:FimV/HubP family polar landmark protein [Marinospirillum sp. MEB164]|uniref:FimV/HubP family polar landmark protein n=1 Tax=Marinospirillum alkalitolerans TaxID=3123374 RepID=A0ABW8PYS9_9GAMM
MGLMAAEQDVGLVPSERALSAEEWRTALVSTHTPAGRRVQVGPRDTLWSLARVHRPANDITIKQAMLAIRDANPHAFPSRNINEMEAGSHLIIPSAAAMRSRTAAQAEEEVRRQNQLWVSSRAPEPPAPVRPAASRPAPSVAAPAAQPAAERPVPSARPATPEPSLQLSAAAAEATELRATQQRLNAVEEELQGVERERDELAERLADMQQQVNTLQSLIRLKDDQLSDLEQQLIDRPQVIVEVPAPQAEPVRVPPVAAAPLQGLEAVKAQPLPYALAGGLGLVTLLLLWGLLAARRRLAQAEQAAQVAQEKHKTLEEDLLAAHNATSSDFDLDVHAHPLNELDELEAGDELQDLSAELDQDPLSDAALSSLTQPAASAGDDTASLATEQPIDPLIEAESLMAYGRLEQAAKLLEAAIVAQPEREDLRLKLLELLVELDDQPQFAHQHQALVQAGVSTAAMHKAEDLARLMSQAQQEAIETPAEPALSEPQELDLGEMDLGEMAFDELDLEELDLADASPAQEPHSSQPINAPESDESHAADAKLETFDLDAGDFSDLDLGEVDLEELDLSEFDLETPAADERPAAAPEAAQNELSADDELDLLLAATQEEAPAPAASVAVEPEAADFDFELDLDQPLEAQELEADLVEVADFDPVQPNQEASDFLSALDGLDPDDQKAEVSTQSVADPQIDAELSALSEDLSELESLMIHEDLQGADDLVELETPAAPAESHPLESDPQIQPSSAQQQPEQDWDLELATDQLDGLDALGDLDDLDFAAEESEWTTQLDLATAYIEMGDKQGARDILEKIVELADPDHAATAQQMLEQLG